MRLVVCLMIALSAAAACVAAETTDTGNSKMLIPKLPEHPRLLLTAQGVTDVKARVAKYDWAKARWEAIKARVDQELGKEIMLPPRGGNWYHWYACPVHGCSLSTGKQIGPWQWEHKCPVGGEILLGDPTKPSTDYDGCRISNIHGSYSDLVEWLGFAYQMTGEAKYANRARDIALAYANIYLSYPIHNISGEPKLGGRIGPQNLDESTWLIPVCQGLDMIWDTLTPQQRDTITTKLIIPAAKDVIKPNPMGIHNIQNWRNSAMGLAGFLVGDEDLIRYAIDDPTTGFRTQMAKGVSADGCWFEGAWGYHFYTMHAIWPLLEAARNCGIDLYVPEYKRMFDAPLEFAMPNMALPAFNDSGQQGVGGDLYELAYARYKDPLCLEVLSKSGRNNDMALFFGEPKLPAAPSKEWKSANYPRSGYAILAKGSGSDATWLCMKYGPHGSGHGHPDKLNFVLYAKGRVIGIDSGTAKYGLPIHAGWNKTTLAHNTLTVDEHSQHPTEGKCIAFGSEKGVDYAVCNAGDIYDGVDFARTAAMLDENLIVVIDRVKSTTPRTFDIAYHELGKWQTTPDGSAWTPPDKDGYRYLKDATSRSTDKDVTLTVDAKGLPVAIQLAAGNPTEVITATGIGSNIEDRVPAVIFRRHGKDTTYVWALSLDGKPAKFEQKTEADALTVTVTSASGKKWTLVANPGAEPTFAVE